MQLLQRQLQQQCGATPSQSLQQPQKNILLPDSKCASMHGQPQLSHAATYSQGLQQPQHQSQLPDSQRASMPGMLESQHAATNAQGMQQSQHKAQLPEPQSGITHGPRLPLRPRKHQQKAQQPIVQVKQADQLELPVCRSSMNCTAQRATAMPSGQENSFSPNQIGSTYGVQEALAHQQADAFENPSHASRRDLPQASHQSHLQQPWHAYPSVQSSAYQTLHQSHTAAGPSSAAPHLGHGQHSWHPQAMPLASQEGHSDAHANAGSSMTSQADGMTMGLQHALLGDERSASDASLIPGVAMQAGHPPRLGKAYPCTDAQNAVPVVRITQLHDRCDTEQYRM